MRRGSGGEAESLVKGSVLTWPDLIPFLKHLEELRSKYQDDVSGYGCICCTKAPLKSLARQAGHSYRGEQRQNGIAVRTLTKRGAALKITISKSCSRGLCAPHSRQGPAKVTLAAALDPRWPASLHFVKRLQTPGRRTENICAVGPRVQ